MLHSLENYVIKVSMLLISRIIICHHFILEMSISLTLSQGFATYQVSNIIHGKSHPKPRYPSPLPNNLHHSITQSFTLIPHGHAQTICYSSPDLNCITSSFLKGKPAFHTSHHPGSICPLQTIQILSLFHLLIFT